ncbi:type II toxin-antitoxin system antitoxin SocA domain-containing protein [Bacillus sp. FSL K6-6483]
MNRLEGAMYYFIKHFPQTLGRTMLIKAIYLLDCEWYKSFGKTYTGLRYLRDQNGPFDTSFYEAKDSLIASSLITEEQYYYSAGYGFNFKLSKLIDDNELGLDLPAISMAEEIVDKLSNKDRKTFLDYAYSTPPMQEVLDEENAKEGLLLGRELDMSRLNKPLKPLFDLDEIKVASRSLDMEDRGSDEDYNKAVIEEMNELSIYKERVEKIWELTGEK